MTTPSAGPGTGPISAEQLPYVLAPGQAVELFNTEIRPLIEPTVAHLAEPTALILGGQPAAGKTSVQAVLRADHGPDGPRPLPGAVGIDIDMFDHFHPAFEMLRRRHPMTARALIRPDALRLYGMAGRYLVQQRANIIYEHALQDLDRVDARLRNHHAAGYRVELALMAVPRALSLLSNLSRYQSMLETSGQGRFVPVDVHDLRYQRTQQAAERFDTDPRLAALRVYRRGGHLLHYQEGPHSDGSPAAALDQERHRPWDVAETEQFRQLHASLVARMDSTWGRELDRALQAAEPLLNSSAPQHPWRNRAAVTFGRYQLVSVAHLDTIRTILRQWPTVTVGVLDPALGPGGPLDDDAPKRWAAEKNPLSVAQRIEMWQDVIDEAGLVGRVRIVAMAGMTPDPEAFNREFPADQFDMVFPQPEGTGFDLIRNDRFREQFHRHVFEVQPSVTYHTSAMRALAHAGDPAWQRGLAPAAGRAFAAAQGPHLLLGLTTPTGLPAPPPQPHRRGPVR